MILIPIYSFIIIIIIVIYKLLLKMYVYNIVLCTYRTKKKEL